MITDNEIRDDRVFRILIVDDEKGVRRALENSLKRSKQFRSEIATAEGGETALGQLELKQYDLLLSDYKMPGMNGVELLAAVREKYPKMIRILITGHHDLEIVEDATARADMDFYLKKPWDDVELSSLMHYALEKKRLEDELRRYTDHLEEEIQLRLKEVIQAEKLASLGQLVAGIAHEINSPLTVISLYAQMLASIISEEKPKQYVEVIISHVNAVSRIVSGLLDFSRSSKTEKVNIDLNEVTLKVLNVIKYQLDLSQISVNSEMLLPMPLVFADPDRIQQVIMNIIINAHQAMGKGGTISIVTERYDEETVQLSISDNGKGIADKDRDSIFKPFFTTKSTGGTGLGLSISKEIIDSHGGELDFESTVGEGTSFNIRLPINN